MKKRKNEFYSIELFAGAGGLALGLEQAGFKHKALIENDINAANTLKTNRKNWNVINEDIEKISSKNLEELFNIEKGELDLLSGGAPCQSFSYAGKRQGFDDVRGTLFYHFAIFINKLKPKMFLFENVKGLLSHDNGKTLRTIIETFNKENYAIKFEILNAWDYDVPQKRERLILIGIRKDISDKTIFNFPKKTPSKPVLNDILHDVPNSEGSEYSETKRKLFKLIPQGGCWTDLDEEIAKKYMKKTWNMGGGRRGILRRMSLLEPSLTILTSPQMKQTERCHPLYERPFNIRESARIQGFPDDWTFIGNIVSKYKQIGNAVPVGLSKHVGKELIKTLKRLENKFENL